MKKLMLIVLGLLFCTSLASADERMRLMIGGRDVTDFKVVGDRIYVPEEVLAGFVGIGPSHCNCGSTDLQRGLRSIKYSEGVAGMASTGLSMTLPAIQTDKGLTYPLREVCEFFNYGVDWNKADRVCTISMKERLVTSVEREYSLILDVRTPEEFDMGHIFGAVNIPLESLKDRIAEVQMYRSTDILIYCKGGKRSAQAVDYLIENGFTKVYHLYKGFDSIQN